MAKMTLPVNFKDDIIRGGTDRRYRVVNNEDGTISLEDVTNYEQIGSDFNAAQVNQTNAAVNASADAGKIIDSMDTIRATTKSGYMAGALAVKQLDDEINGNLSVEEIQLTNLMAAGSKLYKSGHIYTLIISMANVECSNGLMIGSIPSQHAPLSIIYAPIVATGNLTKLSAYLNAGISINMSGHIQISGVTGTGNIITTATWIK